MRNMVLQRVCQFTKNANSLIILPSLGVRSNLIFRVPYSTDDKVTEMADKARSTAEEFLRQAKEKKDEFSDAAKETLESSKEAVLGETEQEKEKEKEKFKEKVEEGDYDRIGRP